MQRFNGFQNGKNKALLIPSLFFSELLPFIDDLNELKVTLYCFWAMQQQEDEYRYVRFGEVSADAEFMKGLQGNDTQQEWTLRKAFEKAVARGTLLHVQVILASKTEDIYFINTEKGQRALEALVRGEWVPSDGLRPIELIVERPNVFVLYEQNVGPLTPLIAEQLIDAEKQYPPEWITEAIQIAVKNNARSLKYILRILEQWLAKGKQPYGLSRQNPEKSFFAHLEEDYSDIIES